MIPPKLFQKRHILFLNLAVFLLAGGTSATSYASHPVVIEVSPEVLEKMDADQRTALQAIQNSLAKKGIEALDDYEAHLPKSVTSEILKGGKEIISLEDLFIAPTQSDEPRSLSYIVDPSTGVEKKIQLSSAQLNEIKEEGLLTIPSRAFPGQVHVWEISRMIQKGRKNIHISLQENLAFGLKRIIVFIPDHMVGETKGHWSARKGVRHIGGGLRGILGSVIGLIERVPAHSEGEVLKLIAAKKETYLQEALKIGGNADQNKALPPEQFDLRLFDQDLAKTVQEDLMRIERENQDFIAQNEIAWRAAIQKEIQVMSEGGSESGQNPALSLDPKAAHELLEIKLEERKFESLNERLRSDAALDAKARGYGTLVANQRTAVKVSAEAEMKLRSDVAFAGEEAMQAYQKKHSVLGKIQPLVEKQGEKARQAFLFSNRWTYLEAAAAKLAEKGLFQEARLASEAIQFQRELEPVEIKKLAKEKKPAQVFEVTRKIWLSKNWRHDAENHRAIQEHTMKIPTDRLFWRWQLMGARTVRNFTNGLHGLLVDNLWNGYLGVRAMNPAAKSFHPKHAMNGNTGEILLTHEETPTWGGHFANIAKSYKEARAGYEQKPDNSLLGKNLMRPFFVAAYGIKAGAQYTAVGVGQPLLTLGNLIGSGALIATAPVWGPLSALFEKSFDTFIYDTRFPGGTGQLGHPSHQNLPFFHYLFKDVGVWGVGQIGAKVVHTAVDGGVFVGASSYAYLRAGVRTAYDAAIRGIFGRYMKVPGQDGTWATRKKGPGLSSHTFYQVQPEVALVGLVATLEQEELRHFRSAEEARLQKPLKEFDAFLHEILSPLTLDASELPVNSELRKEEKKNLKALTEAYEEQRRFLSEGSYSRFRSSIRLKTEDLGTVLADSIAAVKIFYAERLLPHLNAKARIEFWDSKKLLENDFEGLARHYLELSYGDHFLVPLEKNDETFVIEVHHEGFKDIFKHFPRPQNETPMI